MHGMKRVVVGLALCSLASSGLQAAGNNMQLFKAAGHVYGAVCVARDVKSLIQLFNSTPETQGVTGFVQQKPVVAGPGAAAGAGAGVAVASKPVANPVRLLTVKLVKEPKALNDMTAGDLAAYAKLFQVLQNNQPQNLHRTVLSMAKAAERLGLQDADLDAAIAHERSKTDLDDAKRPARDDSKAAPAPVVIPPVAALQ